MNKLEQQKSKKMEEQQAVIVEAAKDFGGMVMLIQSEETDWKARVALKSGWIHELETMEEAREWVEQNKMKVVLQCLLEHEYTIQSIIRLS